MKLKHGYTADSTKHKNTSTVQNGTKILFN